MSLLELFCHVHDCWLDFAQEWEHLLLESGLRQRRWKGQLCASEIMTLMLYCHQLRFRDFKTYYTRYVQVHLRSEFPALVSYNRCVELIPSILLPLCVYLQSCYGTSTGISFVDSTAIRVGHHRRIGRHRVFAGLAQRGKTSVDGFYRFKLHRVINDCGELLACRLTAGNVDDRTPLPTLVKCL